MTNDNGGSVAVVAVDETEKKEYEKTAIALPDVATKMAVTDDASDKTAKAFLLRIKTLRDWLNKLFDPAVKSAYEHHKLVKNQKNMAEQPLIDAELIIKRKINQYSAEQETKRIAMQKQADATAKTMGVTTPVHIEKPVTKMAGVSEVKVRKFEITDPNAVPDQFWIIDESAIRKYINAFKGECTVAGVRIWTETDVRASAKRSVAETEF